MTDFTQRVNYRRALEGELERTISTMRGVESAQVHLAIQKTSVLRRNGPEAEASVVLALRSGSRPERAMVEGVASLVAGSVEGLDRDYVTVLDDTGRLLSSDDSESDQEGLTTRQLAIQREVEGYLEAKAYELVEPVVGAGNITVRVAAALNFDQIGRTVETFDLEQQTTLSEDRSEIIPGSEEQGASSLTVNTVYETPRSIETFNRSGAQLERLTVAVVVNERQVGEGDQATSQPRTQAELARVEALVRNALGITDSRGDAITVVNLPFDKRPALPEAVEEGTDVVALLMAGIRPTVGLAGLILAFVLALRLMGSIKAAPPALAPRGSLAAGEGGALGGSPSASHQLPHENRAESMPRPTVPKLELSDPNITAKVVRAWMSEEGGQG
jgi:flagellar M-ring protein FliF